MLALLVAVPVADAAGTRPMRFDKLSIDEGLSQSTVLSITQDASGYIWFGTEAGLNRFDGHRFEHFYRDRSNPLSLSNNFIWDMAEDQNGDLWIATDGGGLVRWSASTERFSSFRHDPKDPHSLADDSVRALFIDKFGLIWIGMRDGSLDRLDPKTGVFVHYGHRTGETDGLPGEQIYDILADGLGLVWIGTNSGLSRLDPATDTFRHYRHDPNDPSSISDNRVRTIQEDRDGTLWVGTLRGGLNRLYRRTGEFTTYRHDPTDPTTISSDRVRVILEDDNGRLWVGTGAGLNMFDREAGVFHRYMHNAADPHSLSDSNVMSLFEDDAGVLWIGTKSAGVNKWNPRSWALGHYAANPDSPIALSSPYVTSFAEDNEQRVWVGTMGGGLNVLDRKTGDFSHLTKSTSGLSDNRIMALLTDHTGAIWAGTMAGGINRIDPVTREVTVFPHDRDDPTSLSADGIMALFEDANGSIWAGTYGGGVNRYDRATGTFERYGYDANDPTKLSSPRATSFAEHPAGVLWIDTDGGGLNMLDVASGTIRVFRHDSLAPRTISADTIYSLHVDPTGDLWIGTRGGLDLLEGSWREPDTIRFRNISREFEISNDVIYGVQSDRAGNLWLSTNHGLLRFDQETRSVKTFHRSHGLQAEEFNYGAHYASATGELLFGGPNGFNMFHPGRLEINEREPPIVLTSFTKLNEPVIADKPYRLLDKIQLDYSDDIISFGFAALDFTAPSENRYAYKLEGFNDEWIDARDQRLVTYTNLDQGRYTFRVKAANSDGVWNENGLAIELQVAPAPWRTWWAYLLYAAAGIALIAWIWRRQHLKHAREAEYMRRLEQEVDMRTRELADRNTDLQAANNKLLEASVTDPLTGLRNRRFVFEEISKDTELIRRHYSAVTVDESHEEVLDLSFMMIDLDHFKPVNDTCGHAAGDQLLIQIRDVLLHCCRASDFVIRWGGDEFLVIGRHTDKHDAIALAERIRTQIDNTVFVLADGQVARTTCSIGLACYPFVRETPDVLDWEQVLGAADTAMYRAKAQRNAWVGFFSTPDTFDGDVEEAFRQIRGEPENLERDGRLDIRRSFPHQATDAKQACA